MARTYPPRIVDHKGVGYMRNFRFSTVLKFHKWLGQGYPHVVLRDYEEGVCFQSNPMGTHLSAEVLRAEFEAFKEKEHI